MQHFRSAKSFSVFFFVYGVLSFSVDLLSIVLALSHCMHGKGSENITKYFESVM